MSGYMNRRTGPFSRDQATCPHQETAVTYQKVDDPWGDYADQPWNHPEERVETTEYWDRDIDIHRFQCTHCGRIGYYSGEAQRQAESAAKAADDGIIERRLTGYAECRCILSQYCDGACRPIFESVSAAPQFPSAETEKSLSKRMSDAGFHRRDNRIACDECGQKIPSWGAHECTPRPA